MSSKSYSHFLICGIESDVRKVLYELVTPRCLSCCYIVWGTLGIFIAPSPPSSFYDDHVEHRDVFRLLCFHTFYFWCSWIVQWRARSTDPCARGSVSPSLTHPLRSRRADSGATGQALLQPGHLTLSQEQILQELAVLLRVWSQTILICISHGEKINHVIAEFLQNSDINSAWGQVIWETVYSAVCKYCLGTPDFLFILVWDSEVNLFLSMVNFPILFPTGNACCPACWCFTCTTKFVCSQISCETGDFGSQMICTSAALLTHALCCLSSRKLYTWTWCGWASKSECLSVWSCR